jgi:site-specific DNA-methyltransferase (adenine-specific)
MVETSQQELQLKLSLPDRPTQINSNVDTRLFSKDDISLYHADVLTLYSIWDSPTIIISDGAYGLGLFPGDPPTASSLMDWYEPHIQAWTERATPETTLWFWNSELGWASIHPLLVKYGWRYISCHVWDKGMAHVAGNSNTQTLRKFPVVTEVCVQYVKEAKINDISLQEWLRKEWERTGLSFSKANTACGVKNAATRKYLTKDHLWYFPPPDAFDKLVMFANQNGKPDGKPYFSRDGKQPITPDEWARMRTKFYCKPGITNVWREPPLNGSERFKANTKSVHLNQKPLKLLEMIIEASSDIGDLVWEPFGGLCSAAIAARKLDRRCVSADIQPDFYELALERLIYSG